MILRGVAATRGFAPWLRLGGAAVRKRRLKTTVRCVLLCEASEHRMLCSCAAAQQQKDSSGHSKCWNCGKRGGKSLFCGDCKVLQAPKVRESHFDVLDLEPRFDTNENILYERFKKMQHVIHPDRFGNSDEKEQEIALKYSSQVNEAYNVLKDPLKRAIYLLEQNGITALSEGGEVPFDEEVMEFMERMMEERSIVFESSDLAEVKALNESVSRETTGLESSLHDAFSANDLDAATKLTLKLRYLRKLLDDIEARLMNEESHNVSHTK